MREASDEKPTQLTNTITTALKKAIKCVQQNQSLNWKQEMYVYETLLEKIIKEEMDVRLSSRHF